VQSQIPHIELVLLNLIVASDRRLRRSKRSHELTTITQKSSLSLFIIILKNHHQLTKIHPEITNSHPFRFSNVEISATQSLPVKQGTLSLPRGMQNKNSQPRKTRERQKKKHHPNILKKQRTPRS